MSRLVKNVIGKCVFEKNRVLRASEKDCDEISSFIWTSSNSLHHQFYKKLNLNKNIVYITSTDSQKCSKQNFPFNYPTIFRDISAHSRNSINWNISRKSIISTAPTDSQTRSVKTKIVYTPVHSPHKWKVSMQNVCNQNGTVVECPI